MKQLQFLLGISGGIAAYKSAVLTRLLVQAGHTVQVVMTEAATHFVTPTTFQALSGRPVYTDIWDARVDNQMAHIELSRRSDAIVVMPATANVIAKIAHGFADDLLSTLCAARRCPLTVVPAMNCEMWGNPANLRNIDILRQDGITILGPDSGEQACGEVGEGRMLEPEHVFAEIVKGLPEKILSGRHVLLTAGPTFERIDPVRGITNLSSGKMGYALADAAAALGATVTLVSGPTQLSTPVGCNRIEVESGRDMHQAVMQRINSVDIFIAVAAVADYYVLNQHQQKIKKNHAVPTLELALNPDILHEVAALANPPFCVGFAAETEALLEHAQRKRVEKKIPLIVANLVPAAIGSDNNAVVLVDAHGEYPLAVQSKQQLAAEIMQHIAARYQNRKG